MKELRKVLKTEKIKSDMLITVKWKLIQNSTRKRKGNFSNISNKVQYAFINRCILLKK